MEKNFIRVRSTKDYIISIGLTVSGCILLALPTGASINILGFFMIFTGLILYMVLRTGYKDEETGIRYCKAEHFFPQAANANLCAQIASKPDSIDLSTEDQGNSVRLDIYFSKASGKAYLQVFEYVPYKYEPCSKQFEHPIEETSKIR